MIMSVATMRLTGIREVLMQTKTKTKTKKVRRADWICNECGRKFYSVRAAERAVSWGCPKCGGSDIESNYE